MREEQIFLTTHKKKADKINYVRLKSCFGDEMTYEAIKEGYFPYNDYPTNKTLRLKVGARVMFLRNNPEEGVFNGTLGVVVKMNSSSVSVLPDKGKTVVECHYERWEKELYTINIHTNELEIDRVGSFTQIPLKLAWAMTIHKSQGLTFNKVVIDIEDAFASGQTYVALSRCKTMLGISLISKIQQHNIMIDNDVVKFMENVMRVNVEKDDNEELLKIIVDNNKYESIVSGKSSIIEIGIVNDIVARNLLRRIDGLFQPIYYEDIMNGKCPCEAIQYERIEMSSKGKNERALLEVEKITHNKEKDSNGYFYWKILYYIHLVNERPIRTPIKIVDILNKERKTVHKEVMNYVKINRKIKINDFLSITRLNGRNRFFIWSKEQLSDSTIIKYSRDDAVLNLYYIKLGTARDNKGFLVYAVELLDGTKWIMYPVSLTKKEMIASMISKYEMAEYLKVIIQDVIKPQFFE